MTTFLIFSILTMHSSTAWGNRNLAHRLLTYTLSVFVFSEGHGGTAVIAFWKHTFMVIHEIVGECGHTRGLEVDHGPHYPRFLLHPNTIARINVRNVCFRKPLIVTLHFFRLNFQFCVVTTLLMLSLTLWFCNPVAYKTLTKGWNVVLGSSHRCANYTSVPSTSWYGGQIITMLCEHITFVLHQHFILATGLLLCLSRICFLSSFSWCKMSSKVIIILKTWW